MRAVFAEDPQTASLLREATRFADAKNWDAAISCLREARSRMQVSPVSYPIKTWLRLPLYLQKAGRFQEAVDEFRRLIDESEVRVARDYPHQTPAKRRVIAGQDLLVIREKMKLAQRREAKRQSKSALFKQD